MISFDIGIVGAILFCFGSSFYAVRSKNFSVPKIALALQIIGAVLLIFAITAKMI